MVSVIPTARDLVFKFSDSCNCWSQCCCYPLPPKVYVNSLGEVEHFDNKKATSDSINRSKNHILQSINRKALAINADIFSVQNKVLPILEEIHMEKETNLNHIAKLNQVMLDSLPNLQIASEERAGCIIF